MTDLTDMTNHRLVDEYWLRKRAFDNAANAVTSDAALHVFIAAASLFGDVRDELRERGFAVPLDEGVCRHCGVGIHERLSADGIPYWHPNDTDYDPCSDENGRPAPHASGPREEQP